jgi:transcriptional regulator of heat shock response
MLKKSIVWYLVFAMFVIVMVPRVEAGFIPSNAISIDETRKNSDLDKVQKFLETKLVAQRLGDLGFSSLEVKERLSLLSDNQLHNYAQQLDSLKVGGDGVGAVIGVLVIIILVLVILHLTGHKVIIQ